MNETPDTDTTTTEPEPIVEPDTDNGDEEGGEEE